jgi:hypothetical protein
MKLRDLFEALSTRKVVCIFPGSFTPLHKGHASVYNYLLKKFPQADVFVGSSNYRTAERPLAFEDKKYLASQAGIPENRFVEVREPYRALEITKNYDPTNTVIIFAMSEKDKNRLGNPTKKDGSLSYFQPYPGSVSKCETFNNHGYYIIAPVSQFTVLNHPMSSASEVRELYKNASEKGRLKIAQSLYPSSHEVQKIKYILDNVLGSEPIVESNNSGDTLFATDGWLLPNGTYYANGFKSHIETARKHGAQTYEKAFKKGWFHCYVGNGILLIGTDQPMDTQVHDFLVSICKKVQNEYPEIDIDCAKERFKWDGKNLNQYNRRMFESDLSSNPIKQDGWILPNGRFLGNQPNSGHFEVLKKQNVNSYEDAFNKGWIHVSTGNGQAFLEVGLPMAKMEKRLTKIANMMQDIFPEIYVTCGDSIREYVWTGKEFTPLRRRHIREYKTPVLRSQSESALYKKKNGSKTAPITGHGWLLADGTFVHNGFNTHVVIAEKLGFGYGYDPAFDAGAVRVAIFGDYALFETSKPMTPELDNLITKAIKRTRNLVRIEIKTGSGAENSYKEFEWDGKQIVQKKRRMYYEGYGHAAPVTSKLEIEKYKKRNGSRTSPIEDSGWLFPNGLFVPNGRLMHLQNALKLGYGHAYEDAYEAGLIRVVYSSDYKYLETPQKISPKLETLAINAIKRMSDSTDVELLSGSGTGFFKIFEWDGKQLVSKTRRVLS